MILTGVALRRAVGDPTDIEVTIRLLDDARAPRE
jgi:hypothetical protein